MNIDVKDVADRFPRPLSDEESARVEFLISDAVDVIEVAFAREGRDFENELMTVPWLPKAAKRVVIAMVSAAVTVGPHAGQRSAQSTTGQESDSITWTDSALGAVSFGGVELTDAQAAELGLGAALPWASAPQPPRWPEVLPWRR